MSLARCPLFGRCGGCQHQDLTYSEELALKEARLKELLRLDEALYHPMVPSPQEYFYRNRLDLKLKQGKDGGISIGFTPVGGRGIIEVDHCPVAQEPINAFLARVKREAKEKITPKYREANLTVRSGDDGRAFWGGIGRRSNELAPKDYLWTTVEGKKVHYSLDTFFQVNTSIIPKVFEVIKAFGIWNEQETHFYDLYGGVGLFGIGLAQMVKQVLLIEHCEPAVKIARHNLAVNNLTNVEILEGKVEKYLDRLDEGASASRVAMIDPPRAGLSEEACRFFSRSTLFAHLMYLSCKPESLARDLPAFLEQGWEIEQVIPFDFFPQTRHIETLVLMRRAAHPSV